MVLGAAALDLVYMLTLWVKSWHRTLSALIPTHRLLTSQPAQVEIDGVAYRNAWLLYFFGYAATWCVGRATVHRVLSNLLFKGWPASVFGYRSRAYTPHRKRHAVSLSFLLLLSAF